jgi:hypothetical protein
MNYLCCFGRAASRTSCARVGLSAPSPARRALRALVSGWFRYYPSRCTASPCGYRFASLTSGIRYASIKYLRLTTRAAKRRYLLPEAAKLPILTTRAAKRRYLLPEAAKLPILTTRAAKLPILATRAAKLPILATRAAKRRYLLPEAAKLPIPTTLYQ